MGTVEFTGGYEGERCCDEFFRASAYNIVAWQGKLANLAVRFPGAGLNNPRSCDVMSVALAVPWQKVCRVERMQSEEGIGATY